MPPFSKIACSSGVFGDLRQGVAVLLVAGLADRKLVPFDGEAGLGGGGLDHFDGFRNDLEADIVAEQYSNFQSSVPFLTRPASS